MSDTKYSDGKVCTKCGGPRSNESKSVCKQCNMTARQGKSIVHRPTLPIAPLEGPCKHHWIIDTPKGPLSHGVCRLCKEEREFNNAAPDRPWENQRVGAEV